MKNLFWRGAGLLALGLLARQPAQAQPTRVADYNTVGWFVYEGDHGLGKRWAVHTEYQWRRVQVVRARQQALARLGLTYRLAPRVQLGGGYTSLVTHPYGDYPTAGTGVPFPEHRIYEDVTLSDTLGRLALAQRVRLEQRWVGQLNDGARRGDIASWQYQHRIRYQLAATRPLKGARVDDGEAYLTAFDEVFLNFGQAVGGNIFNQNRIGGGLGYQVRDGFQVELQYLNQITQHADPDPATDLPVFEFNHGFRLGVSYNFTLVK